MNIIKLFQDQKKSLRMGRRRRAMVFSVVDVVEALTDSNDPKQYIKKMRSRDEGLNSN